MTYEKFVHKVAEREEQTVTPEFRKDVNKYTLRLALFTIPIGGIVSTVMSYAIPALGAFSYLIVFFIYAFFFSNILTILAEDKESYDKWGKICKAYPVMLVLFVVILLALKALILV